MLPEIRAPMRLLTLDPMCQTTGQKMVLIDDREVLASVEPVHKSRHAQVRLEDNGGRGNGGTGCKKNRQTAAKKNQAAR